MSGVQSDCVFAILPELYDPVKGYSLCAVWGGIQGAIETYYHCGHDFDLAREYANELNYSRGYNPKEVTVILENAMGTNKIHFFDT